MSLDPEDMDLEPGGEGSDLDSDITILIAEDDPLLLNLLTDILAGEEGFQVVGGVTRGSEVLDAVERLRPRVLLLDLNMPEVHGLEILEATVVRADPPVVLVMSADEGEETQLKTARAGAHGFLCKSTAKNLLGKAIRMIASGEVWFTRRLVGRIFNEYPTLVRRAREQEGPISVLSDREREVLLLLSRGLTNKQIADSLYMSISTVKSHIRSVFQKLDLSSRTEAAIFALREGLEDRMNRPTGL